jgi:hypothetical protein
MREAEIERAAIPSQSSKKFVRPQLNGSKKVGLVVCASHPSYGKKHKIGG